MAGSDPGTPAGSADDPDGRDALGVASHLIDGLDLSAVRLFLAVDELGSVAKAATRVGIAQPSATVKLRKLERLLGLPLLDRQPTGSALTAGGAMVAAASRDLLGVAAGVIRAAERGREGETRLRIATTEAIGDLRLAGLLEPLNQEPAMVAIVDVIERDTGSVARAVRSGEAALGLLDGPFAPLGLRSEVVGQFHLTAVAHPSHPLAGAPALSGADLLDHGLIVRRPGSGSRDVIEAALAEHGFGAVGRVIEVESTAGAIATARIGGGIAVVPHELVAAAIDAGELVAVALTPSIEQPIRLCWNGTLPQGALARRLVEAVLDVNRVR